MIFEDGRSIYRQIVEYVESQISNGEWLPDDRIPSVRELAVELGVNPNTIQRSYSMLQEEGLIYNQRGLGYFVSPDGPERSRTLRRAQFETEMLPRVFETMRAIGYTISDLENAERRWERGELGKGDVHA